MILLLHATKLRAVAQSIYTSCKANRDQLPSEPVFLYSQRSPRFTVTAVSRDEKSVEMKLPKKLSLCTVRWRWSFHVCCTHSSLDSILCVRCANGRASAASPICTTQCMYCTCTHHMYCTCLLSAVHVWSAHAAFTDSWVLLLGVCWDRRDVLLTEYYKFIHAQNHIKKRRSK